eukprot:1141359-Pelagomonas_calceolata.AAC.2
MAVLDVQFKRSSLAGVAPAIANPGRKRLTFKRQHHPCKESTQRQPQPLHLLPWSVTLVSSSQNRGTSILWSSNTVKIPGPRISSRPRSIITATSVAIFQRPQLKSPSIRSC